MARVTVDTSQVDALARDLERSARQLKPRARQVLRKVALDTERRVKVAAPVLTGRFRASWSTYTSSDLVAPNSGSSAADTYHAEGEDFIESGSNLEYAEDLNAGSSRKAPAGFIDAALAAGERALDAGIAAVLAQVAAGR